MANECKKFALFACCLMTMQALRLVISTAGFCVVRFHIDCELFNIFISRLVNAVMMSQLFGNWLGDLIVFAANGFWKLHAIALANWAEFICFCSGLGCICAGEAGMVTGFYWSMVGAYFWWKVGEAPATSIGGDKVDWYFAGFTLSGVWSAMLKSVTMMFIVEEKGVYSEALGQVNVKVVGDVSVVGARSVKTTVDYRAAKSLFAATILVTAFMCLLWDAISESVDNEGSESALDKIKKAANTGDGEASAQNNKLLTAIKAGANGQEVNVSGSSPATLNFSSATVNTDGTGVTPGTHGELTITVGNVTGLTDGQAINPQGQETIKTAKIVKTELEKLIGSGTIAKVTLDGNVDAGSFQLTVKVFLAIGRKWIIEELKTAAGGANQLQTKIREATGVKNQGSGNVTMTSASVTGDCVTPNDGSDTIQIVVENVEDAGSGSLNHTGQLQNKLHDAIGQGKITSVTGTGDQTDKKLTLTVTLDDSVKNTGRTEVEGLLKAAANDKAATDSNNKLVAALKGMGKNKKVEVNTTSGERTLNFTDAEVNTASGVEEGTGDCQIKITVGNVSNAQANLEETDKVTHQTLRAKVEGRLQTQLKDMIEVTAINSLSVSADSNNLTITVTAGAKGRVKGGGRKAVASVTGLSVGGIFAVPGALMFAGFAKWCKKTAAPSTLRVWAICGALVGGMAAAAALLNVTLPEAAGGEEEEWVDWGKWVTPKQDTTTWAAMIGLTAGLSTGALMGLCIGTYKGSTKRGLAAGAFYGSFFGLWIGEICNAAVTWQKNPNNFLGKPNKAAVVVLGIIIVVGGLGTVYSIYPGMAPCSITQFQYFNIIDIWILILSAIAPIVIMVMDLAEHPNRLAMTILFADGDGDITSENGKWMWAAVGSGIVMLIATLICEIIVLDVLQHPFSKTAQKVKNSAFMACFLTIMMVTLQLTSTGIGFGCVGAGSGLNVGVMNLNSTLVLWTVETCAVLGEGYLIELKKYEPGMWPTQGMGKWATYKWWNRKTFGNAWQIWSCICTTDLRRDIMLCRQ